MIASRSDFLGLGSSPCPAFAPLFGRARDTWARLSSWSHANLPDAAATIGEPAGASEWGRFIEWLSLDPDAPGLLALRLVCGVHDGQQIAHDVSMARRQLQQLEPEDERNPNLDHMELELEKMLTLVSMP